MGISPAEVRLRRLLAATPQQENKTKLLHYIASMREQLAALNGDSGHDDLPVISAAKAQAYARDIDEIAEKVNASAGPHDVWESLRAVEDDKSAKSTSLAVPGSGLGPGLVREVQEEEEEEGLLLGPQTLSPTLRRRRLQRERREQEQEQAGGGRGGDQQGGVKLDSATTKLIDRHRNIQDTLIDEMAIFSEQLKNNSLMMEQSLKDTERVLDHTEEAVEHSLSATNRANIRAGFIYKASWRTGCFTWLMLFLMCLIFIFMIGVIRITG